MSGCCESCSYKVLVADFMAPMMIKLGNRIIRVHFGGLKVMLMRIKPFILLLGV
jgi:hypothetical protein